MIFPFLNTAMIKLCSLPEISNYSQVTAANVVELTRAMLIAKYTISKQPLFDEKFSVHWLQICSFSGLNPTKSLRCFGLSPRVVNVLYRWAPLLAKSPPYCCHLTRRNIQYYKLLFISICFVL